MTETGAFPAAGPTLYLERPGGRIAYDVAGSGPLIVGVPGMGDLRSVYRFLVPALTDAGFRVASMDLRGHGDSDATFDAYDDVAAGTDLIALVEHLGGPAVLVGNSMGAGAAAWAAAEAPHLVAGLVLVGPFVRNAPVGFARQTRLSAGSAPAVGSGGLEHVLPETVPGSASGRPRRAPRPHSREPASGGTLAGLRQNLTHLARPGRGAAQRGPCSNAGGHGGARSRLPGSRCRGAFHR